MRLGRILALAAFCALGCAAQTRTLIQPDCVIGFTFTAAGQATNPALDQGHNTVGCVDWTVVYFSTGFSALSLVVQSAPDNNGVPGSWATFAGTVKTGINPNTAITSAQTRFDGYFPWNRVTLASKTGTGKVVGQLYGCRAPGCSQQDANATPPMNTCPSTPLNSVQYDDAGACGGSAMFYFPNGVPAPPAPSGLNVVGMAGMTSLSYQFAWRTVTGISPLGLASMIMTAPAVLDSMNFVDVPLPACPGPWVTGVFIFGGPGAAYEDLEPCGTSGYEDMGGPYPFAPIFGTTDFSSDASAGFGTSLPIVSTSTGSAFGNLAFANNDANCPLIDCITGLMVVNHTNDASFDYLSAGVLTYIDSDKNTVSLQVDGNVVDDLDIGVSNHKGIFDYFQLRPNAAVDAVDLLLLDYSTQPGSTANLLTMIRSNPYFQGTVDTYRFIDGEIGTCVDACTFTTEATGFYLGDWSQYPNGRAIRVLGGQTFLGPDESALPPFIQGWTNGGNVLITDTNYTNQAPALAVESGSSGGNQAIWGVSYAVTGDAYGLEGNSVSVEAGSKSVGTTSYSQADTGLIGQAIAYQSQSCFAQNGGTIGTCIGVQVQDQVLGTSNFAIQTGLGFNDLGGPLNLPLGTVSFSATPVFNAGLDNFFSITLTNNVTSSTLINLEVGQNVTFHVCQDGTGGRTFVPPTNAKGFFTIGATASKCSDQTFWSPDGSNVYAVSPGVINL